ncbi:MAG: mechanosensitive ion channel family protein [Bacteroidales bacterium]|nr:mechanosensitive ion channel family protein [Bacteroidales bacterium]MCF8389462.1 mechanosensitive ion channel family protein [Bacteroidales bacterium]
MIEKWIADLAELLNNSGLSDRAALRIENLVVISSIIILAIISDYITKRILITSIKTIVKRTANTWDDVFITKKVFHKLAHFAPAIVLYYCIDYAIDLPKIVSFIKSVLIIYMMIISLLTATSFVSALHSIYLTFPVAKEKPIKGYVQLLNLFLYFVTIILIYSHISGNPAKHLLTALGAVAAVLLLVFKDTLLGLVASVQISANQMVKPGDWIVVPSRDTDGTVLEISLNTVKVQNWDKTISSFPTYALINESFQNWKGMEESGGRRIKRSINIDMNSVKFLDEELKGKLKKLHLIKEYIEEREKTIDEFNIKNAIDTSMPVNGRRMTNLGILRRYLEAYLKNRSDINTDMTFLVRQLQPSEKGIPIEIYVFSKIKVWSDYESLQSDIFDHVLAAIPWFDLRVFQNPGGGDLRNLIGTINSGK